MPLLLHGTLQAMLHLQMHVLHWEMGEKQDTATATIVDPYSGFSNSLLHEGPEGRL